MDSTTTHSKRARFIVLVMILALVLALSAALLVACGDKGGAQDPTPPEPEKPIPEEPECIHDFYAYEYAAPTCALPGHKAYSECINCGLLMDEDGNEFDDMSEIELAPTGQHTWTDEDWEMWESPTCSQKGTEKLRCSVCSQIINEREVPATPHNENTNQIIDEDPTCTEPGSAHTVCYTCGNKVRDIVLPATGHNTYRHWGREATCVEEGEHDYYTCTRCEKDFEDEEGNVEFTGEVTIPKKPHTMDLHVTAKEPDCENSGNYEYWYCSTCYKYYDAEQNGTEYESTYRSALGHNYDGTLWDYDTKQHFPVCTRCNKPSTYTYEREAHQLLENGICSICNENPEYKLVKDGDDEYYEFYDLTEEHEKQTSYTILDEVKGIPVKRIRENAFWGNKTMLELTLPASLQSIGDDAFDYCTGLQRVNVSSLNDWCKIRFEVDYESSTAYSNPLSVYDSSAGKCNARLYVDGKEIEGFLDIEEGVTTLPDFGQSDKITGVHIPKSVTKITTDAFASLNRLTHVDIADVKAWCQIEFGYGNRPSSNPWYNATQIAYGYSSSYVPVDPNVKLTLNGQPIKRVEGLDGVEVIPDYAFTRCYDLEYVSLPATLTKIGEDAFRYCANIKWAQVEEGCEAYCSMDGFVYKRNENGKLDLCQPFPGLLEGNNGVVHVPEGVDYFNAGTVATLTELHLPSTFTSLNNNSFPNLKSITVSEDNPNFVSKDGVLYRKNDDGSLTVSIVPNALEGDITIPENCKNIDAYPYSFGNRNITSLTIPETLETLNVNAFGNCNKLKTVNWNAINATLSYEGSAFSSCSGLTTVNIGDKVESIPAYLFNYCRNLRYVDLANVRSIGNYSFGNCYSLKEITIPATVSEAATYAFYNCHNLVHIRDLTEQNLFKLSAKEVLTDATAAFSDNLKKTTSGIWTYTENGVTRAIDYEGEVSHLDFTGTDITEIAGYAFYHASGVTEVTIPGTVTDIGDYAFAGMPDLVKINYNASSASDASIGKYVFSGCSGVTSLTIGNSVKEIPSNMFNGLVGLTELSIPSNVKTIGDSAFYDCDNLENVTISEGVQSIYTYAFGSCGRLFEVTVPSSVTSLVDSAFSDCTKLFHIRNLSGKELKAPVAEIGEMLTEADAEYQNVINREDNGVWTLAVGDTVYAIAYDGTDEVLDLRQNPTVNAIYDDAFRYIDVLTTVILSENIQSIGEHAFYNCANLATVVVCGDNITEVGSNAFASSVKVYTHSKTANEWQQTALGRALYNAGFCLFAETDPFAEGLNGKYLPYWHWNEDETAPELWARHRV